MRSKVVVTLILILASNAAFAQGEWWQNPVVKYKQSTGVSAPGCGPHYWCKDKSEQFLFCPVGFLPRDAGVLYSLPALVSATSSGQVAPIVTGSASTLYGGAWKGAAISDQLGRIITGNGDGTTCHASLPIGNPCVWSKDVTVFSITNEGSASTGIDGMAFSHDSQYLYSDLYNPSSDRNKIRRWSVGNLAAGGIGLTTNATYITSLGRVRNVGVYYINGQDLIYYGEGNGGGKVCVMDPATGVETVLVNSGLPSGSVAYDIMNVKVAGVQSGTKHLYVQMDGGALYIYDLASDGKSAGACVKAFTSAELQSLLGASWPNMRAFEVLDNETHAFFSHHWGNGGPSTNKILIYVVNNVNNLPPPPTNAPPVAYAQSVTTPSATATNLTLTGTDPESTNLFYTVVTPPAHGTLSGTAPNVTYTPATNYIGDDSFTFQVNDGALDSTPATVSISVTPIEVDLDIDGVSSGNTFSPGQGGFLAKGGWVMITLDVEGARSARLSWNSEKIAIYTATNGTALSNPTDWPDASTMPSTLWVYGVEASASGPTATNCGPEHITLEAINNGASYATPYVARAGFTVVNVDVAAFWPSIISTLGQAVTEAEEADPMNLFLAVNDDDDNGDGVVDNEGASASSIDAEDDEMAALIVRQFAPSGLTGTLTMEIPSGLRLFSAAGAPVSTPVTVDLSAPTGPLAGILTGDVTFLIEATATSSDAAVVLRFTPSVGASVTDAVHMTLTSTDVTGSFTRGSVQYAAAIKHAGRWYAGGTLDSNHPLSVLIPVPTGMVSVTTAQLEYRLESGTARMAVRLNEAYFQEIADFWNVILGFLRIIFPLWNPEPYTASYIANELYNQTGISVAELMDGHYFCMMNLDTAGPYQLTYSKGSTTPFSKEWLAVLNVDIVPVETNVTWNTNNAVLNLSTNSYWGPDYGGSVIWSSTPDGLSGSGSGGTFTFNPSASQPTSYVVTARSTLLTNCYDTCAVNVYRVELTPDATNVCWQSSNPVEIVLTNSYAPGGITWSGTNGLKVVSATDTKLVFTPTNSVATNYAVKATATGFTNCYDMCMVIAVKVDLDIYRLEGNKVTEDKDHTTGSITRILNLGAGEAAGTGRDQGISLKLEPSVDPTGLSSLSYKLRLKIISNTRNEGLVRVYRRNGTTDTKILDNTPTGGMTEAALTEAQFSDMLWMEFERGGIIEIELVTLIGTAELSKDSVRASGIACNPKSGSIYFVNPSGTAVSPYDDFTDACAANLASIVGIAPVDANIVVAGAKYNESGLTVATKVMIAGLGAAFEATAPYAFKFDDVPIVDAGNAAGIFLVDTKQDDHFSGLVLQKGKRQNGGAINAKDSAGLSICYTKFSENKADDFGGGVYLQSVAAATINGCVLTKNAADHDAGETWCYDMGMGGGVASILSTLTVTNCLFQQNFAQVTKAGGVPKGGNAGGGGDIYLDRGTLKLLNCRSDGARAGVAQRQVNPPDDSTYFTGDGGAILVHGRKTDTTLEIRNCGFYDSISYGNGGAISLSRESSPSGRRYFVKFSNFSPPDPLPPPWAVPDEPFELSGGCVGVISNTTFEDCMGGWQGGAISANGRGMELTVVDTTFLGCKGGNTHERDGKGGAIAVCGGVQMDSPPQNYVAVKKCAIRECIASGNGGGFYVTIRGKLTIDDTTIQRCSALDEAALRAPNRDSRLSAGMGGGIHVSAGGYVYVQVAGSTSVQISGNNAAVSGGGLSVKSGKAFVQGSLTIQGNKANGNAAEFYGNGGGAFVTTSVYDDSWATGAGWGAATLYNDHGEILSIVSGVTITGNEARRWGGGVYAGISPPWYGSVPPKNVDEAKVTLKNATVENNMALRPTNKSPLMPSQIASERVGDGAAVLDFSGTSINGNPVDDIGIYLWDSMVPLTTGTAFGSLPVPNQIVPEVP